MKRILGYVLAFILVLLLFIIIAFGYSDKSVEELKRKYANHESDFLQINGIDVHFRDEGEGMPLLLLHGTASSLHTWNGWTDELKDDFRVIRLDLPAFGLTGPAFDGDYAIQNYVSFLHTFLEELDIDSLYIAGNSLGGQIAWSFAADYPDLVKKLVLINSSGIPKSGDDPMVFRLARTPIMGNLLKFITPKAFIKKNLKEVYYQDEKVSKELIQRYHDMALRVGNRQAFIDRSHVINADRSSKLKALQPPTLLLWGKEDQWVPYSSYEAFKMLIPNLESALIDSVGHVPMEEAPIATSQIAKEFLIN